VEKLGYTLPETLTWDFMFEVAEAATKKDENGNFLINGQKVMIPIIYKSTDNMMIQMLRQRGADYSDADGNIGIFNDVTKEILFTLADQTGKGTFSTFKISSYPGNFFNAGQCIFAIDSTAGATWIGSDAPLSDIHESKKVGAFETRVMAVPQYDPENPVMISQGPSMCVFNKDDPQEVLASWLFMQYLLTDDIQISYSQTEGYTPVTAQAQGSAAYADYLARAGEDNELYYDVKLAATRLVLENTENTFVTAVFNGSASLRNAAGQLIENVAKSTMRRQTVDEAYMQKMFREVSSLYRLDQMNAAGVSSGERADLGALPQASVMLLCALGGVWLCIIAYMLHGRLQKISSEKKKK
jgi:multiple sugar transport system substrate-binding protein